jgi:HNH endonuclease
MTRTAAPSARDDAPSGDTWMNRHVLVLNASYERLGHIDAPRAVILLLQDKAESVEDFDPVVPIRSRNLTLHLPHTMILRRYVFLEHHILHGGPRATSGRVLSRDSRVCGYCGGSADTVDHILPRSRKGPDTWDNMIAACGPCNLRKADKTPEEAGMRLLWPANAPRASVLEKKAWRGIGNGTHG